MALGVDDLKPRHIIHDSDSPVTSFLAGPATKSGFFAGKQVQFIIILLVNKIINYLLRKIFV